MAKPTGFLEYARADAVKRPVPERLKDWYEIRLSHKQEEITRQAARCMNCGIPFCHSGVMLRGMASGCPVRNLIIRSFPFSATAVTSISGFIFKTIFRLSRISS